jgi:hypothetical protein
MTAPPASAPTFAAGSVGTVETRYLDLPNPLALDCGRYDASSQSAFGD